MADNPRKRAAEQLADVTDTSGDVASVASIGGWIDEEGVINFGTKVPSESGIPSLTQEQRADWLESQLRPPKKTDIIKGWGLDIEEEYQESDAIEAQRLLLPEGEGGWDPKRATPDNPKGAWGDNFWWIKHGSADGTDGLGDGTWETGPSEADAWAHVPIGGDEELAQPLESLKALHDAMQELKNKRRKGNGRKR